MLLCGLGTEIQSQTVLQWSDLSRGIVWQTKTNFSMFREAEFSPEMTTLEGTDVILTGYFLFLDGTQSIYLLSKNPMASCFFCGNGGPETIVELQFSKKPPFTMDDLLSVSGILRLNRDNPSQCYYRIEQAKALSL